MVTTIWNKLHFGLWTMDDEMLFSQADFNLRIFRALSTLWSEAISSFSSDFVTHLIMAANHCLRDTGISFHRSLKFFGLLSLFSWPLVNLWIEIRSWYLGPSCFSLTALISAVFKDFFFSIPGSYLEALVKVSRGSNWTFIWRW